MHYGVHLPVAPSPAITLHPFEEPQRIGLIAMKEADAYTVLAPLYHELINRGHKVWIGWASEFEKFPHVNKQQYAFDVAVFTDHHYAPMVPARKSIVVGHGLLVSKNYTFTYDGTSHKTSAQGIQSEFDHYTHGQGSDFVDYIVTVSKFAHYEYIKRGVPEHKLLPLGYLETDWMFWHNVKIANPSFRGGATILAPTWNIEFRGYLEYLPELIHHVSDVWLKRHPNDPFIYKNISPCLDLTLVDQRVSLVSLLRYARLFVTDVSSAMFLALLNPEIPVWLHNTPLREQAQKEWWYDPEGVEHKLRDFGQPFEMSLPKQIDTEECKNRRYELRHLIYGDLVDGRVRYRIADLVEQCL
jgi:hypothetical protein